MYDVRLFVKTAVQEMGVLPVVRFFGFKALRTSLALICKSIDTEESNFQKGTYGRKWQTKATDFRPHYITTTISSKNVHNTKPAFSQGRNLSEFGQIESTAEVKFHFFEK